MRTFDPYRSGTHGIKTALAGMLLLVSTPVPAGDGVLEINQACALNGGCFAGDSAGFPVTITESGSYRLTGNLTVGDGNTSAIQVSTAWVTIDLGGFSINGPAVCSGLPVTSCTNQGSGAGVLAVNDPINHHITVKNGDIRGMGSNGVGLSSIDGVQIKNIRAFGNGGTGIAVRNYALISDSIAEANLSSGISAAGGARIRDSISRHNGHNGISVGGGASAVHDSSTINNGNIGLSCGSFNNNSCVAESVTSSGNGSTGITLQGEQTLAKNCSITDNAGIQLVFLGEGGYVGNIISGVGATVSGAGAVELGPNLCEGNTTCP